MAFTASPGTSIRLPAQTTPFIGREKEIQRLNALLDQPEVRLVTLLGLGGIGKSRLALAVAEQRLARFENRVYYIAAQVASTWQDITLTIADTIGFTFNPDITPKDQLMYYLRDKRILLVLDNIELMDQGADLINEMLVAAPDLKVLVTSRDRLNLRGEVAFTVEGLPVADWSTVDEAVQSSAAQLFLQSARRAKPDFELTQSNLSGIMRICHLTQGMPLAVELAAAWVDLLLPDEIADEIEQNVAFLTANFHDMPDRHHSIWATFESSWKCLAPEEQQSLYRMAVFHSGFNRRAVQTITNANLNTLSIFINKSLITRSNSGHYEIHELLRQYAQEHLEKSGEQEAMQEAHSRYYLRWLAEHENDVKGEAQLEFLDEVEASFENIRLAWLYAVEQVNVTLLGQSLESLFWYCMMRNRYREAETLFRAAAQQMALNRSEEARLLLTRIDLLELWMNRWREGSLTRYPDSVESLESMLAVFQQAGDKTSSAICILLMGIAYYELADNTEHSSSLVQKSLEMFQAQNDNFYLAWALHFMARHVTTSDGLLEAASYQRQSLELRQRCGDLTGVIYALYNLSTDLLLLGDLELSVQLAQEMFELSHKTGEHSGKLMSTATISLAAVLQGDLEQARSLSDQNLQVAINTNHQLSQAYALTVQGLVAVLEGNPTKARPSLEEAERIADHPTLQFFVDWGMALALIDANEEADLRMRLYRAVNYAVTIQGEGAMAWCLPLYVVRAVQASDYPKAAILLTLATQENTGAWLNLWAPLTESRSILDTESEQVLAESSKQMPTLAEALHEMIQAYEMDNANKAYFPPQVIAANQALFEPLSNRELEILQLITDGLSNQAIADQLYVGISTVKKHITHIYGKLEVNSRMQASIRAQELGLV
ncbi:MAG: LuxR C-terminal-related transcriptional regulator [Anaerolineae bacterium]|nr:LuxR C-terminal-related transcriptional regulator [Anaerolineae bacterium]